MTNNFNENAVLRDVEFNIGLAIRDVVELKNELDYFLEKAKEGLIAPLSIDSSRIDVTVSTIRLLCNLLGSDFENEIAKRVKKSANK